MTTPPPPPDVDTTAFAGFSPAPSLRSSQRSRSNSVASTRNSEVADLEDQLRILELKAQIKRLQGQAVLVEDDEGKMFPKDHPAAAPHVGKIDAKTGREHMRPKVAINFRLSEAQFRNVTARFPGVIFVQPEYGGHDHPTAHIETVLGAREVQKRLPAGGHYLDLFGNPTSNETFNRSSSGRKNPKIIDTLVGTMTAKDVLRKHTKWGRQVVNGVRRYEELDTPLRTALGAADFKNYLEQFDGYLSIHTLYYVTREDIARMLNATDKSPIMTALIHRHKHSDEGYSMFNGEMNVTCGPIMPGYDFEVTQTNVETNTAYSHLSMEWMWKSTSKVWVSSEGLAFTWDLAKFTDESWIVTLVKCDPNLDEGYANRVRDAPVRAVSQALNDQAVAEPLRGVKNVVFPSGKVTYIRGVALVAVKGAERTMQISNPAFYEMLRKHVSGKDRSPKLYAQLVALAVRETDKNNNYPGSLKFDVPSKDISDHVAAAFLADILTETENMRTIAAHGSELRDHSRLFVNGTRAHASNTAVSRLDFALQLLSNAAKIAGKNKLADVVDTFK